MTRHPKISIRECGGTYSAMGYRSADSAALDGVSYTGGGGDEHLQYDRLPLVWQSRAFYRNNSIYKGLIDRAVAYIMGTGFGLQINSRSKAYNQRFEKLWRDWWKRPEIRNLLSGKKVGHMICREAILCGDTAAIKTDKSLVQMIEAEQITKTAYGIGSDGIEKDKSGRPTAYHVTGYNKNGRLDGRTTRKIQPEHFIFVTNPDRPSATRGTPAMQASFPMLHRINDVCDSEAIAYQLISRLAVTITRDGAAEQGFNQSRGDPNQSAAELEGNLATRLTDIDYALLFHANPGEEIKGVDRNIPGKNFTESIRMFMRLLGLPLGMPLELVLLDWTQSNYSQTRAVLWQAYHQTFCDWQDLIADFFLDELLAWKHAHFIQSSLLPARADGLEHNWIKPTFPWIDQLKEAQAYALRMDRTFATHAHVCKSLNLDREEINNAREMEIRDAIDRAEAIEKTTGQKVPWQIFAGLAVPGSKAPAADDEESKPVKKKESANE